MNNEELKDKVIKEFNEKYNNDVRIKKILNNIENKKVNVEETHFFSLYVGELASSVLEKNLVIDGKPIVDFDFEMGEEVIIPLMKMVHLLVNQVCYSVQIIEDEKNKIGLKPYLPMFPYSRVEGLIEELVKYAKGDLKNV